MKTRIMIAMVMLGFCLSLVFTLEANSTTTYRVCEVEGACTEITPEGDEIVKIWLRLPAKSTPRVFIATAGQENRMLAIALTAMANRMQVKANINWSQAETDEVDSLMLMPSE